ncbi:hypothetical protein Gohar_021348, partial [Gossypium harknessii]|nr:hypothetical protein [Gossypium harknessii]
VKVIRTVKPRIGPPKRSALRTRLIGGSSALGELTGTPKIEMGTEFSLEFAKGDIKKSSINGIPSIVFSNRINQMLINDMALMVVIKLLGWNIGFLSLQNKISNLSRPSMPFHLMDIQNSYFLVKFPSKDYYDKVLSQGPWIVFGHLPGHLYNWKILWEIGELIGKVVRLEFNTDSRARGRFARIVIFINLDKPLVSQILINGVIQRIEYESLPIVVVTGNRKDTAVLEVAGG